ncbi:MAG TPA: Sec-dependent nitrous-oxide reductase [Geomonas sp.]|nr:Sec-dependent nitrous-oxide reductase [Geomonas sp.]
MAISAKRWLMALLVAAAALGTGAGCARQKSAADEVYVKPGDHDKYYAFLSGGHSGQVYVYGIPSGRLLNEIPVFSPYARTGYGFDEETKKMMAGYTWGDAHHPAISETNGQYDGRWLFINDMPHARLARINLSSFLTEEITGPIPNVSGLHTFLLTPNTEYALAASRFSAPMPLGTYQPIDSYAKTFDGVIAAMKIDPKSGHMSLDYEIKTPPIDLDISAAGKGASEGWAFFTSYNTELSYTDMEVGASQHDQDFVVAVNWKAAAQAALEGKYTMVGGAKVIDPAKTPGIIYFLPTPKSPHGVDVTPDGKYIVASSKLSPTVTVHSFDNMMNAIRKKDFDGSWRGTPVVRYKSTMVAEVPVGLGPLHTQFDDKGYAYTTLFVDSAVVKWQLGSWKVLDKIPVTYNPGHLAVVGGDTTKPEGKYLLAMNKITKDRFLGVGPDFPTIAQLVDITGQKMRLLLDFPTMGEPHYGQIIAADKLKPLRLFDLAKSSAPGVVHSEQEAGITRNGNKVEVKMVAIRSHFKPDNIEVNQGDEVTFHVTNTEQDENIAHGFALDFTNLDIEVAPGETKTVVWKADKPGVYPFYCSNFCSALHQEMQGYLAVRPRK